MHHRVTESSLYPLVRFASRALFPCLFAPEPVFLLVAVLFIPPAKLPLGLKPDISFIDCLSFCLNRPFLPPKPNFRSATCLFLLGPFLLLPFKNCSSMSSRRAPPRCLAAEFAHSSTSWKCSRFLLAFSANLLAWDSFARSFCSLLDLR